MAIQGRPIKLPPFPELPLLVNFLTLHQVSDQQRITFPLEILTHSPLARLS